MKSKTTQKAIKSSFNNILYCGYGDLQTSLKCLNESYYTVRAEGWASDIYVINNNTCIVTGYAPFGTHRINKELCKQYEQKASNVCQECHKWDEVKSNLNLLINQLVDEVVYQ